MAGNKSVYVCSECGYSSPKWYGKCPGCNEWNTMEEELLSTAGKSSAKSPLVSSAKVMNLKSIKEDTNRRILTGNKELDRVLGGGIVLGSLTLISGDPGIGKSTILLPQQRPSLRLPSKS